MAISKWPLTIGFLSLVALAHVLSAQVATSAPTVADGQQAEITVEAGVLLRSGDIKRVARTEFNVLDSDVGAFLKTQSPNVSFRMTWGFLNAMRHPPKPDTVPQKTRQQIQEFDNFLKAHTVATVTTDFDGKAIVRLPAGDYFLLGYFQLPGDLALWNFPVHAVPGLSHIFLDHNNAER